MADALLAPSPLAGLFVGRSGNSLSLWVGRIRKSRTVSRETGGRHANRNARNPKMKSRQRGRRLGLIGGPAECELLFLMRSRIDPRRRSRDGIRFNMTVSENGPVPGGRIDAQS